MNLFQAEKDIYTREQLKAKDAQRQAEFIAWSPVVFQVSRLMVEWGIFDLLRDHTGGLTVDEIAEKKHLSLYAVKILTDASLSIGTILVDTETERFSLSKTGWFLITDAATRVNMSFNHHINYRGMYHLEEALREGKPSGLKTLGDWATIYEGLSQLNKKEQDSWFGFDHFYSDHSFDSALDVVFADNPRRLMDVGGNTGRFALRCVSRSDEVEVTIVDLPGQICMMEKSIERCKGANRIKGFATNLLDERNELPHGPWDAIWMSQFLDCFSETEISSILQRTMKVMSPDTTLYIMETFWDRQRFEQASFCLTMTSVYFSAMANGNSKMYHSDDFLKIVDKVGLEVLEIYDGIGQGHSLLKIKRLK
ncbi:MAG: methyltransferase [Prevotella sp.]